MKTSRINGYFYCGGLFLLPISLLFSSCKKDPVPTVSYEKVEIGSQVWMKKNLDITWYRNGDLIPEVRDTAEWSKLTTGAWRYPDNDSIKGVIYGKLYNWYAVKDPRGLAPADWQVATLTDWEDLLEFLDATDVIGQTEAAKLLAEGFWNVPVTPELNQTGFSAVPAGSSFTNSGTDYAYWWTATAGSSDFARFIVLDGTYIYNFPFGSVKSNGCSVRCISK